MKLAAYDYDDNYLGEWEETKLKELAEKIGWADVPKNDESVDSENYDFKKGIPKMLYDNNGNEYDCFWCPDKNSFQEGVSFKRVAKNETPNDLAKQLKKDYPLFADQFLDEILDIDNPLPF